jgi:hypothetical protein
MQPNALLIWRNFIFTKTGCYMNLRYRCERLPYMASPRARVSHVGQVCTPAWLVIDSVLRDTLRLE